MIEKIKYLSLNGLKVYDDLIKKIIEKLTTQVDTNTQNISTINDTIINTDISIDRPENQSVGDIWIVETERK